jgi:hypothetical protein
MDMVRHEAKAENVDLALDAVVVNQAQVSKSVLVLKEGESPIISALCNVMEQPGNDESGSSWHTAKVLTAVGPSHSKPTE